LRLRGGATAAAADSGRCARAAAPGKGDSEHERTDGQEQAGKQSNAAERRPAGRQRERTTSPPAVPNGAADKRVFSAFQKQRNEPISLFLKNCNLHWR